MNLRQLLGISIPILQAPMAGVQGSELTVAATSRPCGPDKRRPDAKKSQLLFLRESWQVNYESLQGGC